MRALTKNASSFGGFLQLGPSPRRVLIDAWIAFEALFLADLEANAREKKVNRQ
jgi:hypothetical protein